MRVVPALLRLSSSGARYPPPPAAKRRKSAYIFSGASPRRKDALINLPGPAKLRGAFFPSLRKSRLAPTLFTLIRVLYRARKALERARVRVGPVFPSGERRDYGFSGRKSWPADDGRRLGKKVARDRSLPASVQLHGKKCFSKNDQGAE